ncbi:manganese efflux pump MntP [Ferroacidibacillus organovorans]|nr:manganese efflux pump [Ferroacidibacillus organovorans]
MTVVAVVIFVLSLGMDTLLMSMSIGVTAYSKRSRWRIGLTFAAAEAIMPLIGLMFGRTLGTLVGQWATLLGGVALLAIAVWLIFFENDDEDGKRARQWTGWGLLLTALSVSVDEWAVGLSMGFMQLPMGLLVISVAIQAFFFTWLGLTFGGRLKKYFGEWSEKAAGGMLGLLGLWVLISALRHITS